MATNILLQTTIPTVEDDWHIGRFSLLHKHLESLKDAKGKSLYHVTARDIQRDAEGNDPVLSKLDQSDFNQIWLFALDSGDGLSEQDRAGITAFIERGGGIFTARDHQDLGCSLCGLGAIGNAHFFHNTNPDPDESRRSIDDTFARDISLPNYHSGDNGDYQIVTVVEPIHQLLKSTAMPNGFVEYFPAHPHEGAVGIPNGDSRARVIATGTSKCSGRQFNLVVAFEHGTDDNGNNLGRAIAESSFHHLCDFNWNPDMGCPSFVDEKPSDIVKREPMKLNHVKTYVENVAAWLAS